MGNRPTMLITSIGKRVQLIKHLKESFNVIGVDAGELNAGRYFVDKFYKIPKVHEENYIQTLIDICKSEHIDVLIPLYEGEFEILHSARERLRDIGTLVLLSNKGIIDICKDKEKTYRYFLDSPINVPKVYQENEIRDILKYEKINKLPLIIKPKDGMGSKGIYKTNTIKELEFFYEYEENSIVQQYINGQEYTVDVLVNLEGNPIYIVPRKRIEIRAGEVVKSSTVKDENIINETIKVVNFLNRLKDENGLSLVGPLTIQFFKKDSGKIYLLEINPRFGGGVPLSFEAGANYGEQILKMVEGKQTKYIKDFNEKTMVRYEEAIYI